MGGKEVHKKKEGDCDIEKDRDFENSMKSLMQVQAELRMVLTIRRQTLKQLEQLKQDIEISYDRSRKSRIGGTVGTVVGSVLAITGFGLGFVTFGASLGLTIAGTVMAAAGGVTLAGSEIGYQVVSYQNIKQAQAALDNDRKEMEKTKNLDEKLGKHIESLSDKYPSIPRTSIIEALKHAVKFGKPSAKALWGGYKIIDGAYDAGTTAFDLAKNGAQASHATVWAGLNTVTQVIGVTGVAFNVAFLPIDLVVMIKAAVDVHKYKTKGESNSAAAKKIGELIKKLEQHRDELRAAFENITETKTHK